MNYFSKRSRLAYMGCLATCSILTFGPVHAKGLDDLSAQNPEAKAAETTSGQDAPAQPSAGQNVQPSANVAVETAAPVSYEGPLHQKLSISTSFGWIRASRSEGDWRSNGMSDVSIGYRFLTINSKVSLVGSYRYAAVNIVGEQDDHAYRGVWETHYLGTRAEFKLKPRIQLVGGIEAGYVLTYLDPTDGQATLEKHEENGASFTVGGGADFMISENWAFSAGPRVYAGFGSYSSFQLGAGAAFMF